MSSIREILEKYRANEITLSKAERLVKALNILEIGKIAKIDLDREIRTGIPEIIYGLGKKSRSLLTISLKIVRNRGKVIISKLNKEQIKVFREKSFSGIEMMIHEEAGIVVMKKKGMTALKTKGKIGIITAGTADIPVAEEARIIAEEMGCKVYSAFDVGVAGIHRLFPYLEKVYNRDVDVLIVVAGREGALPIVLAGLVDIPVIGVPTSIGHGYGGGGEAALKAMLQACALGLVVVNIDGGVAAGASAARIANKIAEKNSCK